MSSTESRRSFREIVREPHSRLRAGLAILLVAIAVAALLLLFRGQAGRPVDEPNGARLAEQPSPSASGQSRHDDGADPDVNDAHAASRAANASSQAPRVISAAESPGSVSGEVRSRENGTPVAGAELSFEQEGVVVSTVSQSDGRYAFEPARPGLWRLLAVSADGYLPFAPEWGESAVGLRVIAGKELEGATLWLRPAVTYSGLVVRADGKPAPGAEVRLFAVSTDAALMPLYDRFRCDAQGQFEFRAPPGSVLEARHPRFGSGRARLEFASEVSHRMTIRLDGSERAAADAGLAITGTIRGPDGEPVEHAVVEADPWDAEFVAGQVHIPNLATSDAEGRYRLEGLAGGDYRVSASHGDLAPASREGVSAGGTADLELGAGGRLVGVVTDGAQPLPSFTVQAFRRRGPLESELVRSVSALDPSGHFELAGLPPGPLLVNVTAPGFAPALDLSALVAAEPAPAGELRVVLSRGARLAGRVVDHDKHTAIAGASVRLEGRAGASGEAPLDATVQSGADGSFVLEGLRPGSATIMVAASGHHARLVGGIDMSAGVPIEVALRPTGKDEEPKLELAGLGLVLAARNDALMVGGLAPQGGGAEAGIQVGDGIVAVAGQLVTELGFEGAIEKMRGPENTRIELGVRKKDGGEPVTLVARRKLVRM